jgi:hypothetical protein
MGMDDYWSKVRSVQSAKVVKVPNLKRGNLYYYVRLLTKSKVFPMNPTFPIDPLFFGTGKQYRIGQRVKVQYVSTGTRAGWAFVS